MHSQSHPETPRQPEPHPTEADERRTVPLPPRHASAGSIRVLWEDRVTHSPSPEQLRMVVPVLGWFTGPAFGYLVGAALQQHWASSDLCGLRVQSVAGHLDQRRSPRVLTLLVTFGGPVARHHVVDDAQMARDVVAAVRWAEYAARPTASTMATSDAPLVEMPLHTRADDGRWKTTSRPVSVRRAP